MARDHAPIPNRGEERDHAVGLPAFTLGTGDGVVRL
jgi:hypothetical protein